MSVHGSLQTFLEVMEIKAAVPNRRVKFAEEGTDPRDLYISFAGAQLDKIFVQLIFQGITVDIATVLFQWDFRRVPLKTFSFIILR